MQITAYEFGRIAVDDRDYTADVIITPDRVFDHWWRKQGHHLHVDDLEEIINTQPEVLVIGTGYYGNMQVPVETRHYLEERGIDVRQAKTGDAVAEFNRLQKEYARIVAALHLTC